MKKGIKISQEMIDEAINGFDFEKVRKAMVALDWKWLVNGVVMIPEIRDIKKIARMLIERIGEDCLCIGTGGFEVCYDKDEELLTLRFKIDSLSIDTDLNIY